MSERPWTEEEADFLIPIYKSNGGYMEEGSAHFCFCRPTDDQLRNFLATGQSLPSDGEDLVTGRHIYSLQWWSKSKKDSIRLARKALALLEPGAIFAWHWGKDQHVFEKRSPCQQQSVSVSP